MPFVDEERVVYPEAATVVCREVESVAFGIAGLDLTGPTDGELVVRNSQGRGSGAPVEIDVRVGAGEDEVAEGSAVVVFAFQAGPVFDPDRGYELGGRNQNGTHVETDIDVLAACGLMAMNRERVVRVGEQGGAGGIVQRIV